MSHAPAMPRDYGAANPGRGSPIQVLHPIAAEHQSFAIGAASARTPVSVGMNHVVLIQSSVDCYVRFGDDTVVAVADDMPMWSKEKQVFNMKGDTHIAAIAPAGAGTFYVTPLN